MSEGFTTFQLLHSRQLAEQLGRLLYLHRIPHEITRVRKYFDPSFSFNKFEPDIQLKLMPPDFGRARRVIADFYRASLDQADPGHYLFRFSDAELLEIIRKPDEWGIYDEVLAEKILADRGIETRQTTEAIKERRLAELRVTEDPEKSWLLLAYVLAFAGGFFGMIMGWLFRNLRKTLPNGERVYVYSEAGRQQGLRVMIVGGAVFAAFMLFYIRRTL